MPKVSKTGHVTIKDDNSGVLPVYVRGGTVLPTSVLHKKDMINTDRIRKGGVALVVFPNKNKTASGDLFWDDGDSIDTIENNKYNYYSFDLNKDCVLDIKVEKSGYPSNQTIELIVVKGSNGDKVEATLDGKPTPSDTYQDYLTFDLKINLSSKKSGEKWTLKWKSTKTNSCNIL